MAQELLATFETELGEAALIPGADGVFEVRLDDETIWSRKARGAFPDLAALKRLMRDRIHQTAILAIRSAVRRVNLDRGRVMTRRRSAGNRLSAILR
jgi:selT/selW/selH-like putative selenoprotein